MPTPLELLLDPIAIAVFTLYAGLMCWEAAAPARVLPDISGWKWRGTAVFVVYFFYLLTCHCCGANTSRASNYST